MPTFQKIEDPHFSVRVGETECRADPWAVLGEAINAKSTREQREIVGRLLRLPDGFSLTPHQCAVIVTAMMGYVRRAERAFDDAETVAEILMLYQGAITLGDLREMDDLEKLSLLSQGNRIRARSRLDFISDVASLFDKDSTLRAELAKAAFSNDEETMLKHLEVLNRT